MSKVIRWSASLAYAIGLIASDGCLYNDGRHINFVSKDLEQIITFSKILKLNNKIGFKKSTYAPEKTYYQIQFGNVRLYRFLLKIGLTPNKSKTLGALTIPDRFIVDYLRGSLDGDGYTYSYWDKRWKNSFRLYTGFVSASKQHLEWLKHQVKELYQIEGKIKLGARAYQLMYSKRASVKLLNKIYYNKNLPFLSRKYLKIMESFDIMSGSALKIN